jgi:hypothetical protein
MSNRKFASRIFSSNKNILKECVYGSHVKEAAIDGKTLAIDIKKLSITKVDFDHYEFLNLQEIKGECYL